MRAKIMERLGLARQSYARAAQHYEVELSKDDTGLLVQANNWTKTIKPGSATTHPGVCSQRTQMVKLDNATLWLTHTMLTYFGSGDKLGLSWPAAGPKKAPQKECLISSKAV